MSMVSFGSAVLLSTASTLSLGFVIASIVPTARFAQPISAAVLYLMRGAWDGSGWGPHVGDVAALLVIAGVCVTVSTRVFRWE